MTFALPDRWLWDSWYVRDGDLWHGFFLEAPKAIGDPDLRHWNVSIHHATSPDLRAWTSLGTCFRPAKGPAWDDGTTWTGSVVRGDDGRWHLFYTGTCRAERCLKQRIGHAVSDDLHRWERASDGPVLDIAPPYEEHDPARWHDRAFRDPWVMRDPEGTGWLMFFTARRADVPDTRSAGTIGLATSDDLHHWRLEPPVFTGSFGELEVPQVFRIADRWACLFCTGAPHWSKDATDALGIARTGTHYLLGDSPRGPWTVAPGPLLDAAPFPRRYAGRIVETGAGLRFLGFRWFDAEGGPFVGAISDPDPVEVTGDGLLRLAVDRPAPPGPPAAL